MELSTWERKFLEYYLKIFRMTRYGIVICYYLQNYNAKWMRVYHNTHPLLDTHIDLYNTYKKKLKKQPITGQLTYTNMFKNLIDGEWYFIPNLLKGGSVIVEDKSK